MNEKNSFTFKTGETDAPTATNELYAEYQNLGLPNKAAWNAAKALYRVVVKGFKKGDETVTVCPADHMPGRDAPLRDPQASVDQFAGRECSMPEAIMWTASYLGLEGVTPDMAPGPLAWNMRLWARSSPTAAADFWKGMAAKLVPARTEIDSVLSKVTESTQVLALIAQAAELAKEIKNRADVRLGPEDA